MKERILVTGGTGYIGSHTVVELQNSGYDVVIVDNLSNSSADVVDNIEKVSGIRPAFEKLDCLDLEGMDKLFTKYPGIKGIIHFAASKAVGESVQKPLLYYRNNLVSLINLLELMPKHGVEGIIFSSSCTVYGQPDVLPVTEEAPIKKAESPYGNTKQINEEIIRDTVASGSPINAIMLRYFNPIGAHPTALIGELPNGVPQNLLPYVTQTAMGIREKLSVFGDDYDTPDGSCIRDYIYVVDLAKAHVIAMDRILNNKHPPYIAPEEMAGLQPELFHEPRMALEAPDGGLAFYKHIAPAYFGALKPGGRLILEIGWRQADAVCALCLSAGYEDVSVRSDLSGNPRCVLARRPIAF